MAAREFVINQTALCVVVVVVVAVRTRIVETRRTVDGYGNGIGEGATRQRVFPEHYSRRLKSLRFASNLNFTPVRMGCCGGNISSIVLKPIINEIR